MTEILVVGGGPAGLATAIELARRGRSVELADASRPGRRRLCGEFLSGDGVALLQGWGIDLSDCPAIDALRIGHGYHAWRRAFPGLGRGCTRESLHARLEQLCDQLGVVRTRRRMSGEGEPGQVVLWAAGHAGAARRSPEERQRRGAWLGVAVRARGVCPPQVDLHVTARGYVGLNPVEGERVNLCGLLRAPGSAIDPLQYLLEEVDSNPLLRNGLDVSGVDPSSVAARGGLDFGARNRGGVGLSVGDARGAPVPLLGQGLAAALRGGQLLGQHVDEGLRESGPFRDGPSAVDVLVREWNRLWENEFGVRFRRGRWLQAALLQPWVAGPALRGLSLWPSLGDRLVRATRGPLPG